MPVGTQSESLSGVSPKWLKRIILPSMRIASHSTAMEYRRPNNISSPWLALLAVGLALATLAPMAVVASRLI